MLFNLYVGQIICILGVGCHQYNEDTQLYMPLYISHGDAVGIMNHCLATVVVNLLKVNKLKLNPEKTGISG